MKGNLGNELTGNVKETTKVTVVRAISLRQINSPASLLLLNLNQLGNVRSNGNVKNCIECNFPRY